ncbi:hypothetical protein F2Q69_00053086 [Brassica cretica]|uniref:Uncharacterized protein n=1 Tax=Brassica cretica TaxID=69181 RepID=A0A8S9N561_BRACR|nr:hypothetical protein F2Q69_00053086 [Brassica cretica]
MFSTQLWSTSKKNKIKRSSYVTGMPFTNQVSFSSREFRPPEKLEMANLCSHEPTTNSIMPKGVVKVLKDVSKIQKKSTTTRAPVAKPSLFINEKPKGKSENNFEDLKYFSDSLPIFDKYDEELMESWITCEDECDLPSPKLDLILSIAGSKTSALIDTNNGIFEKVLIDTNNGLSVDTPFSPLIDTTNELSIDVPSREL